MKYFILLLITIAYNYTYSQEAKTGLVEQYENQFANNPIRYYFPDTVNSIIENFIVNDTAHIHVAELYNRSETLDIRVFTFRRLTISDTINKGYKQIFSSNRYCVIKNIALPIIFNKEKHYTILAWQYDDDVLVIRLRRLSPGHFEFVAKDIVEFDWIRDF